MRRIVFAVVTIMMGSLAPAEFLVQDGKSDYVIVVPEKAVPSERRAAEELQRFVKQISGAELPIRSDAEPLAPHAVLLGTRETNRHVAATDTSVTQEGLGEEGFTVAKAGPYLILGGARPRGTMYAVASFLEDDLGCRWFTAKASVIPKRASISLPETPRTEKPAFEYREPFYTEAWEKNWAARNRCNGNYQKLDDETGGHIAYYPWAHSFHILVPPKDFATSHPEYYSEVNGKRLVHDAQLCLTNPDVIDLATRKVIQWIQSRPEAKIISVSQNDWGNPCMCPECKKVYNATGGHSGQLLTFVNTIAERVHERYPDKLIDTLAYQFTEKPPTNVKPADNVRVRLAPIYNCFAHPMDACPVNARAYDNLTSWSQCTHNLYIWHYNTNFAHYAAPLPNLDELQGSTRAYHRLGVKGIFFQGAYGKGGGGELAELRSWVMSKILWNPDRDIWKLVDEFLDGYYRQAAGPIREYLHLMHETVKKEKLHAHVYDDPTKSAYLRPELMNRAEKLFEQAEMAVADEPELLNRVRKARFSIDYVKYRLAKTADEKSYYGAILKEKIREFHIGEISEGRPTSEFVKGIK